MKSWFEEDEPHSGCFRYRLHYDPIPETIPPQPEEPAPAVDLQSGPEQVIPAAEEQPTTDTVDPRRKNINARMLETIQSNPEALGWNTRQWAEYLKCSRPAVVDTKTWQDLKMARERKRAEKARDRRRRPKGSDANRVRDADAG